eukprot:scaffold43684_cov52-Attheya_sp.AAC.1
MAEILVGGNLVICVRYSIRNRFWVSLNFSRSIESKESRLSGTDCLRGEFPLWRPHIKIGSGSRRRGSETTQFAPKRGERAGPRLFRRKPVVLPAIE